MPVLQALQKTVNYARVTNPTKDWIMPVLQVLEKTELC